MLMPKRVKYRKQMRGRMTGKAYRGSTVAFGDYGLMALEPVWMTSRQIEAARKAIMRNIKRRGKVWIRIFPDKSSDSIIMVTCSRVNPSSLRTTMRWMRGS